LICELTTIQQAAQELLLAQQWALLSVALALVLLSAAQQEPLVWQWQPRLRLP
jgi:hypothetical protein